METKDDIFNPQAEEPLSKPPLYHASHDGDDLKIEMIPLKDTTIQVEPSKVTIVADQYPVRDHIVWSIVNTFYMNFCCLGLIALIFSVKSRDQKVVGNRNGARSYGTTARSLNIASSVLTVLWFIIMMAVIYYNFVSMMATIRGWFRK